jgi:hypothetical protein
MLPPFQKIPRFGCAQDYFAVHKILVAIPELFYYVDAEKSTWHR